MAGFWELYLHAAHVRSEIGVDIHPAMPASDRRPDFRLNKSGAAWYLEARVAGESDLEAAANRRRSRVLDALNEARSQDFMVWVDFEQVGVRDLGGGQVRQRIEEWLATLDYDAEAAATHRAGGTGSSMVHRDGDWHIAFTAVPKPPSRKGTLDGLIIAGVSLGPAIILRSRERLMRALRAKRASRYGKFTEPYVVAVNLSHWGGIRRDSVLEALFGQDAFHWTRTAEGDVVGEHARLRNGFWFGGRGPVNRRVSALLLLPGIRPWEVPRLSPTLWLNPWATAPLEVTEPWDVERPDLALGSFRYEPAERPLHELFGLDHGWPGELDIV